MGDGFLTNPSFSRIFFFFQLDKTLALIDWLQKSELDVINIFVTKFGL